MALAIMEGGEVLMNKLYVGNLSYDVTGDQLGELFAQAGQVASAIVISDRNTGRSKGFGFVEMSSDEEAKKAIEMFNDQDFQGRKLRVNEARPQEPRQNFGPRRDN
ncbi:MAG: RNA-binding protein [Patescibacteria group bacterium]|nr:RNA-binding protein [Patescibacteria group bacterium]